MSVSTEPPREDLDSRIIRWINRILLLLGGAGLILMELPQLIDLAKDVKRGIAGF